MMNRFFSTLAGIWFVLLLFSEGAILEVFPEPIGGVLGVLSLPLIIYGGGVWIWEAFKGGGPDSRGDG
jgi:hypothetical protein